MKSENYEKDDQVEIGVENRNTTYNTVHNFYNESERSLLAKDIESLSDVRTALLEMAFNYRRTARLYVFAITVIITFVIVLFLVIRYIVPASLVNVSDNVIVHISSVTLHVAAVILIIYLAQLLIGFSRYHYRVADKLFSQANAVTVCMASGDMKKLGEFVKSMSLDIEFGKSPDTPTDKILDTIAKVQPLKPNN